MTFATNLMASYTADFTADFTRHFTTNVTSNIPNFSLECIANKKETKMLTQAYTEVMISPSTYLTKYLSNGRIR